MTPVGHVMVRVASLAVAIVAPLALFAGSPPPEPTPTSVRAAATIAAATPAATSLPALFEPMRETEADALPPGLPELAGIVGRLPDDAEVLVRTDGGPAQALRIGDGFADWRLIAIGTDRAVFARAGRQHVAVLAPQP